MCLREVSCSLVSSRSLLVVLQVTDLYNSMAGGIRLLKVIGLKRTIT